MTIKDLASFLKVSPSTVSRALNNHPDISLEVRQRVQQLAHRLLQVQPECLLWDSDWPHTQREPSVLPQDVSRYRAIASHQPCDERLQWLRTPELQHQVLVANPAKLYRF